MQKKKNSEAPGPYTREELAASKRFSHSRDLLMALLKENTLYSCREAELIMKRYMERMI